MQFTSLTFYTDLNRVQADAALGNSPLWFGEWAITTQFDNATDDFLRDWADAQKLAYSQGAGWIVSQIILLVQLSKLVQSPRLHSSGTSRSRCLNWPVIYLDSGVYYIVVYSAWY